MEKCWIHLPLILGAEDMKNLKKKNIICKVGRAQEYCRKLVKVANIPEQYLLLPDAEGERYTDIYKYNGDIFLSNLRMRLNHECKMTAGQICYIIGVEGIDTLSLSLLRLLQFFDAVRDGGNDESVDG